MGKAEVTKGRLLEMAKEIVARKGYNAASTKEIAEAAGVSEGTLFKYFKTKENLLTEILVELVGNLKTETIEQSLPKIIQNPNLTATQKLEHLYIDRRGYFDKHEMTIKIVIQEIGVNAQLKSFFQEQILPMIYQVVDRIMEEGVANKEFRNLPISTLRSGFIQILLEPFEILNAVDDGQKDSQLQDQLLQIFISGIKERD